MIFQRPSELAIQATLFLAQQTPGKLSPAREIANHVGAPQAYLAKILQRLTSAGLVRSFRGPGQGVELGQTPSSITLASLVHAVEGAKGENPCALGLGLCAAETPCALHKEWDPIRVAINELLENTTLADLVEVVRNRPNLSKGKLNRKSGAPVQIEVDRKGRRP